MGAHAGSLPCGRSRCLVVPEIAPDYRLRPLCFLSKLFDPAAASRAEPLVQLAAGDAGITAVSGSPGGRLDVRVGESAAYA
jgi:hypothetical protein